MTGKWWAEHFSRKPSSEELTLTGHLASPVVTWPRLTGVWSVSVHWTPVIVWPVTAIVVVSKILAKSRIAKHREDFSRPPSSLRSDIDCNIKLLTHCAVHCAAMVIEMSICAATGVNMSVSGCGGYLQSEIRTAAQETPSVGRPEHSLLVADLQSLTQYFPQFLLRCYWQRGTHYALNILSLIVKCVVFKNEPLYLCSRKTTHNNIL